MLVLTRHSKERLFINSNNRGKEIIVEVLGYKKFGMPVRMDEGIEVVLGITAPENVRVDREEVYIKRLKNEQTNRE